MALNEDNTEHTRSSGENTSEISDKTDNTVCKFENQDLTCITENLRNLDLDSNNNSDWDIIQQFEKCKLEERENEAQGVCSITNKQKSKREEVSKYPVAQISVKENKNAVCLSCNDNKSTEYELTTRSPIKNKNNHFRNSTEPYVSVNKSQDQECDNCQKDDWYDSWQKDRVPQQFYLSDVYCNKNKSASGISATFTEQKDDIDQIMPSIFQEISELPNEVLVTAYLSDQTDSISETKTEQEPNQPSVPLSPSSLLVASPTSVPCSIAYYLPTTTNVISQPVLCGEGNLVQAKCRKILPKPMENQLLYPRIDTETNSSRTSLSQRRCSMKELIDSKLSPEEKKKIKQTIKTEIKSVEDWYKLIDDNGRSKLHLAVKEDNLGLTFYLIEHMSMLLKKEEKEIKEIIDIKDKSGYTPLMYAVLGNSKKLVAVLLRYGADPYLKDSNKGNTCFHMATCHGDNATAVLDLLNDGNHDVDIKNDHGQTVLHIAIAAGSAEKNKLVIYLCQKNYKVGAQDMYDLTPLHYAVKLSTNDTTLLEILLTKGCDAHNAPLLQDKRGNTILHAAAKLKCETEYHKKLITLIITHHSELLEVKNKKGKMAHKLVNADQYEIRELLQQRWDSCSGFIPLNQDL